MKLKPGLAVAVAQFLCKPCLLGLALNSCILQETAFAFGAMGKKGAKSTKAPEEVEDHEEELETPSSKPKSRMGKLKEILARGNVVRKTEKELAEKRKNGKFRKDEPLLLDGSCDLTLGELMAQEDLSYADAVSVMMELRQEPQHKPPDNSPKGGKLTLPPSKPSKSKPSSSSSQRPAPEPEPAPSSGVKRGRKAEVEAETAKPKEPKGARSPRLCLKRSLLRSPRSVLSPPKTRPLHPVYLRRRRRKTLLRRQRKGRERMKSSVRERQKQQARTSQQRARENMRKKQPQQKQKQVGRMNARMRQSQRRARNLLRKRRRRQPPRGASAKREEQEEGEG